MTSLGIKLILKLYKKFLFLAEILFVCLKNIILIDDIIHWCQDQSELTIKSILCIQESSNKLRASIQKYLN